MGLEGILLALLVGDVRLEVDSRYDDTNRVRNRIRGDYYKETTRRTRVHTLLYYRMEINKLKLLLLEEIARCLFRLKILVRTLKYVSTC